MSNIFPLIRCFCFWAQNKDLLIFTTILCIFFFLFLFYMIFVFLLLYPTTFPEEIVTRKEVFHYVATLIIITVHFKRNFFKFIRLRVCRRFRCLFNPRCSPRAVDKFVSRRKSVHVASGPPRSDVETTSTKNASRRLGSGQLRRSITVRNGTMRRGRDSHRWPFRRDDVSPRAVSQ